MKPVAAISVLLVAVALAALPATRATAGPVSPALARANPELAPQGEYASSLAFTVDTISPTVVTAGGPSVLMIRGSMKNVSRFDIRGLQYVFQRGGPLPGMADLKRTLTETDFSAVIDQNWTDLLPTLAAGGTSKFSFSVPMAGSSDLTLALDARGVYPTMVKVLGDIGEIGFSQLARIGELQLLTTVLSAPPAPVKVAAAAAPADPATPAEPAARPIPVSALWPLVDVPHTGVDGVFLNDDLARSISPGGRLATILDTLPEVDPKAAGVTLVVDPMLLDELARMANGYRLTTTPGRPRPPLVPAPNTTANTTANTTGTLSSATTPTSSGPTNPGDPSAAGDGAGSPPTPSAASTLQAGGGGAPPALFPPGTVAGAGRQLAIEFLTRLRTAVAGNTVLVLPYSDPDTVALVRAGMSDNLAGLIAGGRDVAARVLQPVGTGQPGPAALLTTMALPENGLIDASTLATLSADGMTTAVLAAGSVQHAGGPVGAVTVNSTGALTLDSGAAAGEVNAAVTDSPVLPSMDALIASAGRPGGAVRLSVLTATLAEQGFTATGTPVVLMPDHRWTPKRGTHAELFATLGIFAGERVTAPLPVTEIAAGAVQPAQLLYGPRSVAAELAPGYVSRVRADNAGIGQLRDALQRAADPTATSLVPPDPAAILDPLQAALRTAGSAALRPDGLPADNMLTTIEDSLSGLRSGVQITPVSSYTLASSSSPLLISVRNNLPYAVRVRLAIGGDQVRLRWTDPGVQTILPGRSAQVRVETRVTRAGRFQIPVRLLAGDGSDWGEPALLTVNSSAYGTLTVVLIAGAGGLLLVLVAFRIIGRWRAGQARRGIASGGGPGAAAGPPDPDSILGAANELVSFAGVPLPTATRRAYP